MPVPSLPIGGFHRRPLPLPAIAFSSPAGKELFKLALAQKNAEIFFHLSEAFRTQDEPTFCGLGTLVTVLNALEVDPGQIWKGAWRWYAETMLDCCVDIEEVKRKGLSWEEWLCVARCQGLAVKAHRAEASSVEAFRVAVQSACVSDTSVLCVAYSRAALGQSGDGHYSPIGAYEAESDQVLIMDVARFKHPPHWVTVETMFEAMLQHDKSSGLSRGFATFGRPVACKRCPFSALFVTVGRGRLRATETFFREELPRLTVGVASAEEALWITARHLPPTVASLLSVRHPETLPEGQPIRSHLEAKHAELAATSVYVALAKAEARFRKRDGPLPASIPSIVALLLVAPCLFDNDATVTAALGPAAPLLLEFGGATRAANDDDEGQQLLQHQQQHDNDVVKACASFSDDVRMARGMLIDMASSVKIASAMEESCAHCTRKE